MRTERNKAIKFSVNHHNNEIIIIGNGGSNSIASHISQDYTKVLDKKSYSFSDPSRLLSLLKMQSIYLLCNNCYTNTYADLRIEECSSCNERSSFQLTKGLENQILEPYGWLRKKFSLPY